MALEDIQRLLDFFKEFQRLWVRLTFEGQKGPGKYDAIYLHALSQGMVDSCDLLDRATFCHDASPTAMIAFNGLDGNDEERRGCVGAAVYRRAFLEKGIPADRLLETAPGTNTRFETDELIILAKAKGWKTVRIVTVPYHWSRVLASLVGSMVKHGYVVAAYFVRPHRTNWYEPMVGSQGAVPDTTYHVESGQDAVRFKAYIDRGQEDNGQAWKERYGAPFHEIFSYLDKRDAGTLF